MSAPPNKITSPSTNALHALTVPTPPSSSVDHQTLLPTSLLGTNCAPSNNHPNDTVPYPVSHASTAIDSSPSAREQERAVPPSPSVLEALNIFDFKTAAVKHHNTIPADKKPTGWATVSSYAQLAAVPLSGAAVSAMQHAATKEQNILLSSLGAKYGTKIFELGAGSQTSSLTSTSAASTSSASTTDPLEAFKRADVLRTLKAHTTKLHAKADRLIKFPAHQGPGGVSGALDRIFERIAEITAFAAKEHIFDIEVPQLVVADDDGHSPADPSPTPSKKIVNVTLDTPTRNHFARESIKVLIKLSTHLPDMPGSDIMRFIASKQTFMDEESWEGFVHGYARIMEERGNADERVRGTAIGAANGTASTID